MNPQDQNARTPDNTKADKTKGDERNAPKNPAQPSGDPSKSGSQSASPGSNPSKGQGQPRTDADKSQTNNPQRENRGNTADTNNPNAGKDRSKSTGSDSGKIHYGDQEPNDPRETNIEAGSNEPKSGERSSSKGRTGEAGA